MDRTPDRLIVRRVQVLLDVCLKDIKVPYCLQYIKDNSQVTVRSLANANFKDVNLTLLEVCDIIVLDNGAYSLTEKGLKFLEVWDDFHNKVIEVLGGFNV